MSTQASQSNDDNASVSVTLHTDDGKHVTARMTSLRVTLMDGTQLEIYPANEAGEAPGLVTTTIPPDDHAFAALLLRPLAANMVHVSARHYPPGLPEDAEDAPASNHVDFP